MKGSLLAFAAAALAIPASPAAAQQADARTDAQLYVDVERSLRRVEAEASGCGGGYYAPRPLHRVVDLRAALRSLRRFAGRDGELGRLLRIPPDEDICISPAAIEPNLRQARRGIDLLRLRARRSGQWPAPQAGE